MFRFNSFGLLQWLTHQGKMNSRSSLCFEYWTLFSLWKVIRKILIKQFLTAKYNHLPFFSSKRLYHPVHSASWISIGITLPLSFRIYVDADIIYSLYYRSPADYHGKVWCKNMSEMLPHPSPFSRNHLPWKWLIPYKPPESASTVPINLSNRN